MTFGSVVDSILNILAELFEFLRLGKQSKAEETRIKNQEDFKKRQEKQQDVSDKDKDEERISKVVHPQTPEEREAELEEIRKVISK